MHMRASVSAPAFPASVDSKSELADEEARGCELEGVGLTGTAGTADAAQDYCLLSGKVRLAPNQPIVETIGMSARRSRR